MPKDARAVARRQLDVLGRRVANRLVRPEGLDEYTRAHLEDVRAAIARALDPS